MNCPLCNCKNHKIVYNRDFIVLQCQECQLYFQEIYFTEKELFNFYSLDYGLNKGRSTDIKNYKGTIFNLDKYQEYLNKSFRKHFKPVIDKFIEPKNILEIGADAGGATRYMIQKGHNVEVVELYKDFADIMSNDGITVYNDLFENIEFNKKYDIIVALEVIEHFSNPLKCVDKIYELLNDDGYFIFETPIAKEGLVNQATYGIQTAHYCIFNSISLNILFKNFSEIPEFKEGNGVYKIKK